MISCIVGFVLRTSGELTPLKEAVELRHALCEKCLLLQAEVLYVESSFLVL